LLVDPVVVDRHWDYGAPGQTYPCWTILRHEDSETAIVYCEFGFGPRSPWGLVYDSGILPMGMDSGWYRSFAEAYFDSFAATELAIWRVFKEDGGRREVPVTGESDWKSTWAEIERLRELHPGVRYHCGHGIRWTVGDGRR
jgi:hypothetical protein